MKKLISKTLIITVISFSIANFALAAPDNLNMTDNTIQHGQNVTVTGTGFGTKISGQSAPIRYDDFEEGTTVGHDIVTDLPWWSREDANRHASISSDYLRGQGSKNGKFNLYQYQNPGGYFDDNIIKNNVGFATTGKIYANYWIRYDWGTCNGNGDIPGAWQIKSFVLGHAITDTTADTYPDLSLCGWAHDYFPAPGSYSQTYWANYWYPGGSGGSNLYLKKYNGSDESTLYTPGWYNISLQINQGTPGTANGNSKTWISDINYSHVYGISSLNNVMILGDATNTDRYIDALRIGWWIGNTADINANTILYVDNLYIDNSWARVEIGDAATYDSCTHREIQIPSAWSDTGITFTANKGSFADGQAYLYVIDENGIPSDGYLVTFNGSSDTTPPQSPIGLQVL